MKAHLRSLNGRLTVECEGANVKELVRSIAQVQEILDADSSCGLCGSQQIKFRVRQREKGGRRFDFFELICEICHGFLEFGQKTDMVSLYPKRKGESGTWLPNRGWVRYEGGARQEGTHPSAPASAPAARYSQHPKSNPPAPQRAPVQPRRP